MAERPDELRETGTQDRVLTAGSASIERFVDPSKVGESDVTWGDAPPETEQIRAKIEETRNQMGETIDAIQERLSFANISEQVSETVNNAIETAKDTAYDATIGKAVNFMKNFGDEVTQSAAFRTIQKNPFPLALIGIGVGLLAYQTFGRNAPRRGNGRSFGRGEHSALGSANLAVEDASHRAYEGITDKAGTAYESMSNAAGTVYEGVAGAVGSVYTGAEDLAHRANERFGEYGTLAHDKYDEYLDENPLALGAVALAVGAAVGFAIPATRYEGRLMGETRENLLNKAQEAAGSLVEKAKSAATEAGKTLQNEARAAIQ